MITKKAAKTKSSQKGESSISKKDKEVSQVLNVKKTFYFITSVISKYEKKRSKLRKNF